MRELPDFKVASGDPDVRGWTVRTPDGADVGRVHELMVDTAAMRVRYVDVELAHGRRHVMIPVEQMTADASRRAITIPVADAASVPTERPVAREAQVQITDDEIRVPVVEEEIVVEKRPVVKEELVVKKSAVTREQKVEADLRKERVEVERTDRNANPQ